MQSGDWDPTQAGWHALERFWCQRHHRSPLRQTQWPFRGFLGVSLNTAQGCRVTSSNKSEVHPANTSASSRG